MKRARLIIKEIEITSVGEIKNFQMKLPKNTSRIIGVETDVLVIAETEGAVSNPNNNSTL
jgi:hypothetical protein